MPNTTESAAPDRTQWLRSYLSRRPPAALLIDGVAVQLLGVLASHISSAIPRQDIAPGGFFENFWSVRWGLSFISSGGSGIGWALVTFACAHHRRCAAITTVGSCSGIAGVNSAPAKPQADPARLSLSALISRESPVNLLVAGLALLLAGSAIYGASRLIWPTWEMPTDHFERWGWAIRSAETLASFVMCIGMALSLFAAARLIGDAAARRRVGDRE